MGNSMMGHFTGQESRGSGRAGRMREEMTVLLPTADDLRRAMARYAEALSEDERCPTPRTRRVREDTAYTLCVMTNTKDVREATRFAEAVLARRASAMPKPIPVPERAPRVEKAARTAAPAAFG